MPSDASVIFADPCKLKSCHDECQFLLAGLHNVISPTRADYIQLPQGFVDLLPHWCDFSYTGRLHHH